MTLFQSRYQKCYVCQKRPILRNFQCAECLAPKHTHNAVESYRIRGTVEDIVYVTCQECGEQSMGTEPGTKEDA